MRPTFGRTASLRLNLMVWLVVPVLAIVAVSVWLSYGNASQEATLVTDRQLIASARMIAEQINATSGGLGVVIPPSALELFASDSHDEVAYAVLGPKGNLIAGFPGLRPPKQVPADFEHATFNTMFRTEAMRAVILNQPVIAASGPVETTVIVGETLKARNELVQSLWIRGFLEEASLVLAAALSIWIGINRELRPLLRLRQEVLDRPTDRFEPFRADAVQTEIRPLVFALNSHMSRLESQINRQKRFLETAAHQLRTPLAVLKTQVGFARRARTTPDGGAALTAVDTSLTAMSRLTNQLLTLGNVEHGQTVLSVEPVDLREMARAAMTEAAPRALDRKVELVFQAEGPCPVLATPALIHEVVANLIDNEIEHAGPGATATLSVSQDASFGVIAVEDDGAGVDEDDRDQLLERFSRGRQSRSGGSGLGLAIVSEIAQMFGGSVGLPAPNGNSGFRVTVRIPLAQSPNKADRSSKAG